jgi:hypothetical protein
MVKYAMATLGSAVTTSMQTGMQTGTTALQIQEGSKLKSRSSSSA